MNENTVIITENKPKQKKYRKQNNSYQVTDEALFYKIADSGLLYTYLHGVNRDKDGNKVFYLDRNDEIKTIIENFDESEN